MPEAVRPETAATSAGWRPSADGHGGRRRGFTARDLALVAVFAALTAVLALVPGIPVGGLPAPIILANLGVMLSGALLGWRRGAAALLLYIGIGFLGVPMLSAGATMYAGLGRPSIGFVFGYPPAAAVIGLLVQARLPRVSPAWVLLACVTGGIVVDYLIGVPYMAWMGHVGIEKAVIGSAVYLPGDLVKAVIAAAVVPAVLRAMPDLTPALRRR